jgi:hypothetical protein
MRIVSDKSCKENKKAGFVQQLFSANRTIYEIMWKKYGGKRQATDKNTIRRMRFAFRITKATDTHTHSECVLPMAFLRH